MDTYKKLLTVLLAQEAVIDEYLRAGGEVGTPEYDAMHAAADAISDAMVALKK
jgi:hypothetical protein